MVHHEDMRTVVMTVLRKTFGEPMFDYSFNEKLWAENAVEAGVVDGTESPDALRAEYRLWQKRHDEE
jgi:hypothetical protein